MTHPRLFRMWNAAMTFWLSFWLFVNPIVLNYCFLWHTQGFFACETQPWLSDCHFGSLLTLLFSIIVFCDTPKAIFRMWNAAMTFWLSFWLFVNPIVLNYCFLWHTQGFFACETQPWLSDCHFGSLLTLLFSIIVFCDTPKAFSHVKRSHDFLTVILALC